MASGPEPAASRADGLVQAPGPVPGRHITVLNIVFFITPTIKGVFPTWPLHTGGHLVAAVNSRPISAVWKLMLVHGLH